MRMRMMLFGALLLLASGRSTEESIYSPMPFPAMSVFKGIPELRTLNESVGEARSVYYHDQVVAILDIVSNRKLIHCELIEVYAPSDADLVLKNLSTSSLIPHRISFKNMMSLMNKCDRLDEYPTQTATLYGILSEKSKGNPLLAGIIPGTKWCGTGDIARNYHDLGARTKIDRCCRAHDLCPVKIRAYQSRYNLVNHSFFSKSHCACDDTFYQCLKSIDHVSANIIGNIYFNIAQPPCIDDDKSTSDENMKVFVSAKKAF